MHRDVQGDNDKKMNRTYLKNFIVIQDASTNMSNRITVTQDASTNASNRIDKGTDSHFELVLKSLKNHIASLENQLKFNYTVSNSNLIDAQKYHTKYTENAMIPSSNANESVNFVKDNIKNSIDLNSGNSTKDFTITSSAVTKIAKTATLINSLNVKSYKS